jgi:hypothetical protein
MTSPPRGVTNGEWEAMVRALADEIPPPTSDQLDRLAAILRASIQREHQRARQSRRDGAPPTGRPDQ